MKRDDMSIMWLRMIQKSLVFMTRYGRARQYLTMEEQNPDTTDVSRTKDDPFQVTLKQKSVTYGTATAAYENPVCNLTLEVFPRMTNYKDNSYIKRPSLGELHGDYNVEKGSNRKSIPSIPEQEETGFKLGWIQGVLIPCLLNIWGVMLFLRMPWIVSQSGILESTIIIVISTAICGLTTLSLSALCTNGEVKGGGIYFIISRSLGPEFGASVGIVLAFANAVSASLNTIGFCESLNDLLWQRYHTKILENNLDSIRLVGVIAIFVMILICALGIEWESKAQNILIALIVIAMIDFFIGTSVGPQNPEVIVKGFEGFNWHIFSTNFFSDYQALNGFFSIFALFFPSVTGIQAGANISGDLKDPSSSIPKGTLLSLLISMISYIAVVIFAGGAAVRQASGDVSELADGLFLNCTRRLCDYGLQNDYSIMNLMSIWSIWIYIGCFAATLSTALTNLLTVPRLLKALGDDEVYPGLRYFSKGYGKNQEPYRGYVLTFVFSSLFVLIASLDLIAPLITNFYLASYALINFCTFHAALVRPLGWRPTFRCYNKWLSLVTCCLCIVLMFFIDYITSAATFITFFALYLIVMYRQPDVNWGSTTQAQLYKSTLASSYRLITVNEHVKNYQPHILLLCGKPSTRPALVDFANLITKNSALLVCANVNTEKLSYQRRQDLLQESMAYLNKHKVKAFCSIVDGLKFEDGAKSIMQCCGIGKLCPNILMMGYKNDWRDANEDELQTYFNLLHNAFDNRFAVVILRMPKTIDSSQFSSSVNGVMNTGFAEECQTNWSSSNLNEYMPSNFTTEASSGARNFSSARAACFTGTMPRESPSPLRRYMDPDKKPNMKDVLKKGDAENETNKKCGESYEDGKQTISVFRSKLKKGFIDVWWLYDDGGLTMLLPYILNTRSRWSNSKLRIFTLTNDKNRINVEHQSMANLLAKFRIHFSSLKMLSDVDKPTRQETRKFFDELIEPYTKDPNSKVYVSEEELKILEEKTNRQLRLRELLMEYSKDCSLIVMSLPMPRKGVVSAAVYAAWLEVLTSGMPPFLLVRGNHTPVLTFYS